MLNECSSFILDGRWVTDDYNEEKVLEEVTAKGLTPGDLVGDLQDPTLAAEAAALGGTSTRDSGKQERTGSGVGMYRAGGPTTIFGGSGWGPYSDGPLNAVKKSMLNRDGVSEESWMYIAAQRTLQMGEEWKTLRKAALEAGGDLGSAQYRAGDKRVTTDEMDVDVSSSSVKRQNKGEAHPLGVYDPQTGLVFCECSVSISPALLKLLPRSIGYSTDNISVGVYWRVFAYVGWYESGQRGLGPGAGGYGHGTPAGRRGREDTPRDVATRDGIIIQQTFSR